MGIPPITPLNGPPVRRFQVTRTALPADQPGCNSPFVANFAGIYSEPANCTGITGDGAGQACLGAGLD